LLEVLHHKKAEPSTQANDCSSAWKPLAHFYELGMMRRSPCPTGDTTKESFMFGTPYSPSATRALLLGSGELGKEVAIELQRLGVEVIAVDRYPHAPAMHVAHRSHVINMLDGMALRAVIEQEQPHYIIPEIEAIATETLQALETEGFNVIPTARATRLTMDREGIRRLAAETLGLATSPYRFAETEADYHAAIEFVGLPCVVKPVMSSSGKGQSVVRHPDQVGTAWQYAQEGGRAGRGKVIVEGFVPFDYEITLLTVSASDGIHFCAPIGHRQEDGDYRESWQPQIMSAVVLEKSQHIAREVVTALGGYGLFGVELFIRGDEVYFSEVSPRPHDTGMVTLISQDLSEFALHARAILGLPIGRIQQQGPSASAVVLREGDSSDIRYTGAADALRLVPGAQLRLFGKPEIHGRRRLGVALVRADDTDTAVAQAIAVAAAIQVEF
jgi:phosphoribosylglycinamide formyltransferase 2